jgi:DNA polymerase I-like protein with 3'-5' exonuclease and polymerase domains
MADFSFEYDTEGREEIKNILYGCLASSNLNVLISEYLDEKQISFVAQFFKMQGADPLIIYPFPRLVVERDFKKGIEKFFIDNVLENLRDFMNPNNAVVTMGRGLYAATRDVDLQVDAFYYNDEYQPSYFYCPFLENYVYPVDAIARIIKTDYHGNFVQLYDRYVTEFAKTQIAKALENHAGHLKHVDPVTIIDVSDVNTQLRKWIALTDDTHQYVAFDIETGGFNRLADVIGCMTVSFDGKTAYYLDWKGIDPDLVYQFLETRYLIAANGKFDVLFLQFHGVKEICLRWDTMIAGHFLNEMSSASLKTHAWSFTDYGGYDIDLEKFKRKYPGCRYIDIPKPIKLKYAGHDAAVTWQVWHRQREIMSIYPELLSYYERYAMGMLDVFREMEFRGFPIDWSMVTEQGVFLKQKIAESEKAVFDAFNIQKTAANANLLTSKKQLGLFLEEKGWECIHRVKSKIGGHFKVSKHEMNEWRKKGHKEADLILEYNKWTAIYNTFIGVENPDDEDDDGVEEALFDISYYNPDDSTGLWQYRQVDDKIHGTYKTMMTHSHRHSSTEPNLQNLSKRNWETAQAVRKCYQAPLELETGIENADFVKVYDAEHGMRLFRPGDTFTVNWQTTEIDFVDAESIPGIVARYYRRIPKGEFHIFEADASGLQARIAASMSGDPKLRDLFLNNGDFHSTNAYNMMARYQSFTERRCRFADGEKTIMEWEPLKIQRGSKVLEHTTAKDLIPGDILGGLGPLKSVEDINRSLTGYDEFAKNCKYGRLKELRQIAKMCFAKGTKIKITGGRILPEEIRENDIILLETEVGVSLFQWSKGEPKFFDVSSYSLYDIWSDMQEYCDKRGRAIYEMKIVGDEMRYRTIGDDRYINIEDLVPAGFSSKKQKLIGVGIPYTGTKMAVEQNENPAEILGTIAVKPKEKIEFELENGGILVVTPDHEMPVLRDGREIIIPAAEVLETDEFIEL